MMRFHQKNLLLFKTAELEDASRLNKLVNSAYRGEYSRLGWTTEASLLEGQRIDEEGLRDLIRQFPEVRIEMLLQSSYQNPLEQNLIGCIEIRKTPEGVYLGMITIEPQLQNQKLGSLLLEHAERICSDNLKSNRLLMSVITVRHSLIDWYIRKGFYRTQKIIPFPENIRNGVPRIPLEMVILEKNLPLPQGENPDE